MLKKKIILPFILLLTITLALSCDTTEPPDDDLKPGRRDYTWVVDTLAYPGSYQTYMYTIWGASENELWTAGHNERGFGKVYFYNGNHWQAKEIPNIQAPIFYSILGFARDNFYLAGSTNHLDSNNSLIDYSLILNYTGTEFTSVVFKSGGSIFTMTGSQDNIYAAGKNNIIFNYDGNQWKSIKLKNISSENISNFFITSILFVESKLLILAQSSNKIIKTHFFLEYSNGTYTVIDSFKNNENYLWGSKLWLSPNNEIFSVNPSLFRLTNKGWQKILDDGQLYTAIHGTSSKNIFIAGHTVKHFNGKNWYHFDELSNKYGIATAVYCFSNDVYVVFINGTATYIVHGTLY
jgi:hypothetical protein